MMEGPAVPPSELPVDPPQSSQITGGGIQRFTKVSLVAIVTASVPYLWVLLDLWTETIDPLRTNGATVASVYDVQARAIMHGHLWIPNGSVSIEAFVHGNHQYTYFGIFPSLLRIPVLLFTHSLDGRLTALSMLGAWLVTAIFGPLLLWRIRGLVRGKASLGWAEATSYGVLLFSILAGSVLVFLASQLDVYSEDLAWSVALACASLFALGGVIERPSWGRVTACGLVVLLTNINRATTGYACMLAMALIATWFALGRAGRERQRWALPMFLATLVPLVAGCAIDLAKLGIPFGVSASAQLTYQAFGLSRVNGGKYFGLRYLPSTIQAYLTPSNIRVTPVFPYLTLPDNPNHPIAHTALFTRAPTASVLPSMPLLFATGLWGLITAFAPRRRTVVRGLRILLIAMVATAGTVMIFGWVLERFVADFMPLLVLASIIGMVDIWSRLDGRTRVLRVLVPATIGLLALFGFVANIGIAITPDKNWTQAQVDHYVSAERALSDVTGHPLSREVVRGAHFPLRAPMGQLFVMGNCDKLYIADQALPNGFYFPSSIWLPVERAPHTPLCRSLIATATTAPLTANIVLPAGGKTVSGSTVELAAFASSGGAVSSVSFVLTGGSLGAPITLGRGTMFPYGWGYVWNSRSVPNGKYVLTSVATDSTGHTATSPGVTITVHNLASGG